MKKPEVHALVDTLVNGGCEAGVILILEAAIKHGRTMRKNALQHISGSVVEAHHGIPRSNEQVVAVVGKAEVGDTFKGGVGELPP